VTIVMKEDIMNAILNQSAIVLRMDIECSDIANFTSKKVSPRFSQSNSY
jgi:hypothetical protein